MKIGFQGYFLTKPYTGIGQYSVNLLKSLTKIDKENHYLILVPEKVDLDLGENFEVKVVRPKKVPQEGMKKIWWEQIQVSSIFKKEKVDLVHFPYPANPWTKFDVPTVVTVHDTIPWDRKAYQKGLLSRLKHSQTKKALKKASKLLTVSDATANDLVKHFPSLKGHTKTVYNAPSEAFLKDRSEKGLKKVLESYGLKADGYFLYVGGYDERKNVKALADAFLKTVAPNYEIDMVFVGNKLHLTALYKSLNYLTNLEESTSVSLLKGKIRLTGFVSEDDLAALYSGAKAFINTSLQEGFNIPLVEAACSKVPILASDIPVHREILKDEAEFCDPLNEEDIAQKLEEICGNTQYYEAIRKRAKRYVCPYNWDLSAKLTLELYGNILGSSNTD